MKKVLLEYDVESGNVYDPVTEAFMFSCTGLKTYEEPKKTGPVDDSRRTSLILTFAHAGFGLDQITIMLERYGL